MIKTITLIIILMFTPCMQATIIINTSTGVALPAAITTSAFNPFTGVYYIGLAAGGGNFALSKSSLRDSQTQQFSGVATNATITGNAIEFMALATNSQNSAPNIAFSLLNGATVFTQKMVNIVNDTGSVVQTSASLLDATGALNVDGAVTSGIAGITAHQHLIFAAVAPNATPGFGTLGSGIAVVNINQSSLVLQQSAARPTDLGIKAALLDSTTPAVGSGSPTIALNKTKLVWDEQLQRLYIALNTTTNTIIGDTARSVVAASVDPQDALTLLTMIPDAALVSGDTTAIIGVNSDGTALSVSANRIGVMHASTGPSYLIVSGGNGTSTTVGNTVFALPLVDLQDPTDPNQGVIARKTSYDTTMHRFTAPAAVFADLTLSIDPEARVGSGTLPSQNTTLIGDMKVVGDTVYVAYSTPSNAFNESGVIYSQALFDTNGRIIHWTPWTKRAFPFNGISDEDLPNPIIHIAVDANNGTIFAVDATSSKIVAQTSWDNGTNSPLVQALNEELSNGSFSVLDLDQSTRGFAGATTSRYTLFGGQNKVVFARTSIANFSTINSPQQEITDYALSSNLLNTNISGAGAVTSLEYSRQLTGSSSNYFFAGSSRGLFIYADGAGNGFDVSALGALNAPPFTTGTWHAVPTMRESVVALASSGNALYVLTSAAQQGYRIYRYYFMPTIGAMVGTQTLIAQSGIGNLSDVNTIYGMQIIASSPLGDEEQLVLATNHGLYRSNTLTGVQSAVNQATALWDSINDNDTALYNGIGYIDNAPIPIAPPTTLFPFSLTYDSCPRIFNGAVMQLVGNTTLDQPQLLPIDYGAFGPNAPVLYAWSDGARRVMIIRTHDLFTGASLTNLFSQPYNAHLWNATVPAEQIVFNGVVNNSMSLYWVRTIGMTGSLMVGTNAGVIALE